MKKLFLTLVILILSTLCLSADTIPGGDVSGTWELAGSPFYIEGEITIPVGETLFIEPGVEVIFNGHYKFIVNGFIEAIGTEADSILFTAANTSEGWHSIRFYDAPDTSHLSYCIIEYGKTSGSGDNSCGGGIFCRNSNPVISRCSIRYNQTTGGGGDDGCGGGMECFYSSPRIEYCIVEHNDCISSGGGLDFIYSNPRISNCTIRENTASFGCGGIGGAECDDVIIEYCDITGNLAMAGGGIYCAHSNQTIDHCLITDNSAVGYDGGGITTWGGNITITNCTISGNSAPQGSGVALNIEDVDTATMVNTIIAGNTNSEGVAFASVVNTDIRYSDFYSPIYGNFSGNVPTGLGDITQTNANGDSCDVFMNIFMDPMFVDTLNGDYHLTEDSPCIDAGDPSFPFDPDGTIADIGRYYYDQTGINDNTIVHCKVYLHQNFPNPFNLTTTISFSLDTESTENTEIIIYNALGQKVRTLINSRVEAGSHQVVWDGHNDAGAQMPSGVYFYRLEAGDYRQVSKMMLMK